MTVAAFYRFPVFMYHTHMTGRLNNITTANKLEEFTTVKNKEILKDVNLASLYKIHVFYDIAEDVTRIDLTKAEKPADETIPLDDVIAMTLECVRLSYTNKNTFILTNENTRKWLAVEKGLQENTITEPLYTVKTVPLKVTDGDLLYHWAYWPDSIGEEQSKPTGFPVCSGKPDIKNNNHASYQGIGLSYSLSMYFPNEKETRQAELNPLAGYTFEKQNGFITIQAPAASPQKQEDVDAYKLMKNAVECLILSAQANGEKESYRLKIIDPRLNQDQNSELIKLW